jgi:signal transduction histidine kinase
MHQGACRRARAGYDPVKMRKHNGLHGVDRRQARAMSPHMRPTVARWLRGTSLGTRLSLLIALIVIAVVTSVAYLEVRSFEQHIERDLMDSARLGAQSAADGVAQRTLPLDPQDIRDTLHDLVAADPELDAISVIEADSTGRLRVVTSTSTEERAEAVNLAGRAIATKASTSDRSATQITVTLPVPRRPNYAVAVTVGLESLIQTRSHGLRVALGFALPTILLVTILVHFTVRQVLGQPLRAILRTMEETREGNLRARTTLTQHDELGTIAVGLNEMLDQLERFNQSLQGRIDEATSDLSLRNAQLAASQGELLALRESLGRAERVAALGQVAANVVHQAGTPLNLVSGYIQMLRDDPRTDDRVRSKLRTVDEQIQQVTRVLRSMLDHARQPSETQVVDLADIIKRVREVAQPRLARHNIRLQASVAENLPPIKADATQVEMALFNLVTNALDAMPGGGTLSIAATTIPDGIRLEIADTGSGIPPEVLDRLFDPWVTTKPVGQGSGLGLAIVRDVVRAHGGSISASNQAVGARFVIDLPAANSERSAS